jgi:gluconate kinase
MMRRDSHLIRRRMAVRHEYFMPVTLLDSQFATLREPTPDEHPIIVDVGSRPRSPPKLCSNSRSGKAAVDAMNLRPEARRPRKPRLGERQ